MDRSSGFQCKASNSCNSKCQCGCKDMKTSRLLIRRSVVFCFPLCLFVPHNKFSVWMKYFLSDFILQRQHFIFFHLCFVGSFFLFWLPVNIFMFYRQNNNTMLTEDQIQKHEGKKGSFFRFK